MELQMILGLVIGLLALIFFLTKTKVHVFLALLIAAILTGLIGGMAPPAVIKSITDGFGSTLGSMGIIIALGVIMGKLLEVSGAAEKMGRTFVKIFGHGNEEIAVLATGFLTSLAVFCVPAFIILFPLIKSISRKSQKSISALGIATAGGLMLSHSLVPPASGPIGAAGIFGADIGRMMFWGFIVSLPMMVALVIYSKYMGKKINKIPNAAGDGWIEGETAIAAETEIIANETDDASHLPSFGRSIAPILTPILLIFAGTLAKSFNIEGIAGTILAFVGQPVTALIISVLVSIYFLSNNLDRAQTLKAMDEGIAAGAKIILIIGAGGALGRVVNDSGVGNYIAEAISRTPIPPILLPLIIATLLRIIQGSGNVATTTAASISAPIMALLGVDLVFATLAACVGSMFFSYFNDAYFWTINETMEIEDVKDQIKVWSIPSTICWGIGTVMILVLNAFFG